MSLTNAQYDALMRDYNKKQLRNRRIATEREEKIYRELPELTTIDEKISAISVESVKRLLDGDSAAKEELHARLQALTSEREALLSSHGYSASDFLPPYDCPDCKDTGYIDGKRCHCFTQAAIDLVYAQSHLADILAKENFSHYSFDYYSPTLKDERTGTSALDTAKSTYQTAQKFVQNFADEGGNLLLYGNTGCGKTFLTHCIAKELLDQGFSVIYFTAYQFFDIFEKDVFEKDIDAKEAHQHLFQCDLLIIDDLGTEFANSFTTSQLFLCLNERLLRNRSTIISTNLSIYQLREAYSERTSSRLLSSYTLCPLFGEDIRVAKKLGKKADT